MSATDGMLEEWGTRLFHGMPKKAKQGGEAMALLLMSAAGVRSQVRAAIRPQAKQVMVKITGGGRGMKAVAAHFRYISRLGKAEVGGKGQTLELEDENGDELRGADAVRDLQYDWQIAGGYIPEDSPRREAFNIILSMPEGTPGRQVLDAAREFARETFEGHKYVFALHDDTASPHVHLTVRAEGMDGVRLNPRKADLHRWRERFAARLQDQGIDAVATRAATRGMVQAPKQLWRIQAADQGRERKARPKLRKAASVELAKTRAIEAWDHLASALATSSEKQDRALAKEVVRYIGQHFGHSWQPNPELLGELAKRDLEKGVEASRQSDMRRSAEPGVGREAQKRKDRGQER